MHDLRRHISWLQLTDPPGQQIGTLAFVCLLWLTAVGAQHWKAGFVTLHMENGRAWPRSDASFIAMLGALPAMVAAACLAFRFARRFRGAVVVWSFVVAMSIAQQRWLAVHHPNLALAFSGPQVIVGAMFSFVAATMFSYVRHRREQDQLRAVIEHRRHDLIYDWLRRGNDVNGAVGDDGDTLLHWAAEAGDAELVGHLIQAGADPLQQDRLHRWPITGAVRLGHEDVIDVLLRHCTPEMRDHVARERLIRERLKAPKPVLS